MIINKQGNNKTKLARELGISRSSLYYQHKQIKLDEDLKAKIKGVWVSHPYYGHKRLALYLGLNKKRILRVMKVFNLHPAQVVATGLVKPADFNKVESNVPNLTKDVVATAPNQIWCTDFTYLKHLGSFLYLATIIDSYTREIVGMHLSTSHDRFLVIQTLKDGLTKHKAPSIIHSDQGSEYDSADFRSAVLSAGIKPSMSAKSSPWQNSYQESFYGKFKQELGDIKQYQTTGELIEKIYHNIYYYNQQRIHTSLKTTPYQFKLNHLNQTKTTELVY